MKTITQEKFDEILDLYMQNLEGDDWEDYALDLSNLDLRMINFGGRCLYNIDFSGSDLKGVHFLGLDMWGCSFCGCDLQETIFENINLADVNFRDAKVAKDTFVNCNKELAYF